MRLRGLLSGAILIASSLPAWAATPEVEGERCSRYLAALERRDYASAIDVTMERFKAGETSDRYARNQQNELRDVMAAAFGPEGPQDVEPLPELVEPTTGAIVKLQSWTGKGGVKRYVGCAFFAGTETPWVLFVVIATTESDAKRLVAEAIVSGRESYPQ